MNEGKNGAEKNQRKNIRILQDKSLIEMFEITNWFQSRKIREIKVSLKDTSTLPERPSFLIQAHEKDLLSLLDDKNPVLLIGDGGMGKTVASLYLLYKTSRSFYYEWIENYDTKGFAPIWLSEPFEIPHHITVSNLIAEALMPEETSDKKEQFTKKLLEKGTNFLLLFEALNEKGENEDKIIDAIINFRRNINNQRHKILITYRKEQWLTGGSPGLPIRRFTSDEYRKYELLPLQPEQVQTYFEAVSMPDLFGHLDSSQKEMACIPLFMYFFQQLTLEEIKGIGNQSQLYEKVLHRWVRVMIEAESGRIRDILPSKVIKELDDVSKIDDLEGGIFFILHEFAFEMIKGGLVNEFNREKLRHFVGQKTQELKNLDNDFYKKIKWIFEACDTWTLVNVIERTSVTSIM